VIAVECVKLILFPVAVWALFGLVCEAQHEPQAKRYWSDSDSELLWRARYNNCDYGYYVLLDPGVVAHGTHPPNPNHGFLIPLPEVGGTSPATDSEPRFLWVDASYDSWDDSPSLAQAVAGEIRFSEEGERNSKLIESRPAVLAGLKARLFKIAYTRSGDLQAIDEETVALRSDIVYTVGLRTDKAHQAADESQMKRIVAGFRLTRLPIGECTN
jgi:hypothetical protein